MALDKERNELLRSDDPGCDVRVWSGTCQTGEDATGGDKYLCAVCGTIQGLTHEVHHEHFPHISGDEDNLS
jgi:hypothetical protein